MKYQGHLWFFINEKYYFMTVSHNRNQKGESVPWWYITNGDYRNPAVKKEVGAKILWGFGTSKMHGKQKSLMERALRRKGEPIKHFYSEPSTNLKTQ